MAIKKKSVTCTGTGSLTQTLDLGAAYAHVFELHLLSNTDTSTQVTITDADGFVVATVASADYTTKTRYYVTPEEGVTFDTAGEAMAANGDASIGVIAASPLTLVAAGLDAAETLTIDVLCEV